MRKIEGVACFSPWELIGSRKVGILSDRCQSFASGNIRLHAKHLKACSKKCDGICQVEA